MTDEQKEVVHYMVGAALESSAEACYKQDTIIPDDKRTTRSDDQKELVHT